MKPVNSGTPANSEEIRTADEIPRAGRGLEQLHGRDDDVIEQDHLGFVEGLEPRSQQARLCTATALRNRKS